MTSAYFAPLVTLPTVITKPGNYHTRCGTTVTIEAASPRHDFGCSGRYTNGEYDQWHKSGRLLAARETDNDLVELVEAFA